MLLGPLSKLNVPNLDIDHNLIERVSGFKLLGVHISNNLSWNLHVDYICAKVNTPLHYLKRLKRAGLPADRLAHWYITVIRPVLEYCAIVWHRGLSKYQTESIEAIQRRALRIVHPITASSLCPIGRHSTTPDFSLFPTDVTNSVEISLRKCMSHPVVFTICCHQLVTPISPPGSSIYPRPRNQTNCYKSFIHHAPLKFQ